MGIDVGRLVISLVLFLAPAVVVLTVFAIIYQRRGKIRRQRITKGSHRPRERSDEKKS